MLESIQHYKARFLDLKKKIHYDSYLSVRSELNLDRNSKLEAAGTGYIKLVIEGYPKYYSYIKENGGLIMEVPPMVECLHSVDIIEKLAIDTKKVFNYLYDNKQ